MRLLLFVLFVCVGSSAFGVASKPIRIISSSTSYNLMAVAAEEFGQTTEFRVPVVESAGTGRALSLFCSKEASSPYNLAVVSRRIRESERMQCGINNSSDLQEVILGHDGIVIVNSPAVGKLDLGYSHLFKAMISAVPVDGVLSKNPYINWSQIDRSLPNNDIVIYGPGIGSGTRQVLVELLLRDTCVGNSDVRSLAKDSDTLDSVCSKIRSDGVFLEYGDSVSVVLRKMQSDPKTIAILSYGIYEQNKDRLQLVSVEGVDPTLPNIASGRYRVSRPIYMYYSKKSLSTIGGLERFIQDITSENAVGRFGYLTAKGLIRIADGEGSGNNKK